MNEVFRTIYNDLEKIIDQFVDILEGHGVVLESTKLTDLVNKVAELKTMRPNVPYAGLALDDNGYVVKAFKLGDFVPVEDLPVDATRGYYKLVNGAFVLDEARKRLLSEV